MAKPPIRVLLIDDDEDDYVLTRDLLAELPQGGFLLDWAAEYETGLARACDGGYDVCLLDYNLGALTGLDLLREARKRGCQTPMILLTGQSERELDFAAMEAGAADYLDKCTLDGPLLDRSIRYTLLQKRHALALERMVEIRTAELAQTNAVLQKEMLVREQAEAALRESEARFRHLAEALPQIVWVVGVDGALEYVNRQWSEYTGLSFAQTADLIQALECIHPDDRAVVQQRSLQAAQLQVPFQTEFRLRRATDGGYRWFLGRGVPVFDPQGQVEKWYGACTDIDEQKEAEEAQREAARRKDEFLASMAHELRNPLAPIRNALEIMSIAGGNAEVLEKSRAMIGRQVGHLVRLIDDLLDISRISRGKIRLRIERVEVDSVVQAAIETSRPLIDAHQHHLTVNLPAPAFTMDCDPTRLAQVLMNLLNNAAKYTNPRGHIALSVELQEGQVLFRVRDDGIGIPQAMLPHIFEMFIQVQPTDDRVLGGLGIGLAMVRGLVELHGGTVTAVSEGPGRGSEFIVRLPRVSRAAATR